MAKVPDSLAESVPEATRFVPAACVHLRPKVLRTWYHPGFGDHARVFQAEVKPLSQIVWDVSLAPDLIKEVNHDRPSERQQHDDPIRAQDHEVGVKEGLPIHGPPRAWIKDHGPTPNCSACESWSRHGKKHSAARCRRYRDWVECERKKTAESIPTESSVEGPSKELSKPSSVEPHPSGGRVRFTGKQPPISDALSAGFMEVSASEPSDPSRTLDHIPTGDFELGDDQEHTPSEHEGDVPLDDREDPTSLPMDLTLDASAFAFARSVDPLQSDQWCRCAVAHSHQRFGSANFSKFVFCGSTVHLIDPISGLSEDGLTWFAPELVKTGGMTELKAMDQ